MISTSIVTLVFLVCLQTVLLSTVSNCAKTISMYWNTTNSIFRIDNTDHIIDVNKNNAAFEYDQVNIICPVYQPGTYDDEAEKYIIYNVSKEEYETCRITNPSPRVIAICDKPFKTMYFTITFRPFTPQPGGLEFHPGHDYYFISTSSKDDLHRRIGGRCTTHNMKVVFKVCCRNEADSSLFYPTIIQNISTLVSSSTVSTGSMSGPMITGNVMKNMDVNKIINSVSSNVENSGNNIKHSTNHNNDNDKNKHPALGPDMPPTLYKSIEHYYPSNTHSEKNTYARNGHNEQQNEPLLNPNFPPQQSPPPLIFQEPSLTTNLQKKKNKDYSEHSNEIVMNEELTYNKATTIMFGLHLQIVCILSLLYRTFLYNLLR